MSDHSAWPNQLATRPRLCRMHGRWKPIAEPAVVGICCAPNAAQPSAEQQELTTLLAGQMGISTEAAKQTIDQWQRVWRQSVERFQVARHEAEVAAMNAATVAKRRTAQAAIIASVMMLVGLVAAVAGALAGSTCVWNRTRKEAIEGYPTPNPALV